LISFFEWLDQSGADVSGTGVSGTGVSGTGAEAGPGEPFYLFDPCAARDNSGAREAVRNLLGKAAVPFETGKMSGELAECCGYGGHIYASNPDLYGKVVGLRTAESELPYVVYCSNCRDAFAASGKQCSHIFDVIYGASDGGREAPRIAERRMNRRACASGVYNLAQKRQDIQPFDAPGEPDTPGAHGAPGAPDAPGDPDTGTSLLCPLLYPDDLGRKMERQLISIEDVQNIIIEAEDTDVKHYDAETGRSIAHGAVGVSTCWVVYEEKNGEFNLINVYSHRMKAVEEA